MDWLLLQAKEDIEQQNKNIDFTQKSTKLM